MADSAYMAGRVEADLLPTTPACEDQLFAAKRVDNEKFEDNKYAHCTFANVSFKGATLERVHFSDCTFIGCYFRAAKVYSCSFTGCRFIDCDLTKVDIRSCDLKYYNNFTGSRIDYRQIRESLPSEGNLRSHLCHNLANEARKAGDIRDGDRFRQDAAAAHERHLWAAFRHENAFYRSKFVGTDRIEAGLEFLASKIRGRLWGYKRSWLVVLRNWAALNLVVFPLLFLTVRDGVKKDDGPASILDLWIGSIGNSLPGSGISDVKFVAAGAQSVAFVEVLAAVVFAALLGSLIFRSVFERSR